MANPGRLFVFVFCLTLAGVVKAQTNSTQIVAEPQYYNSFYALDASEKLVSLDHEKVTTFRSKAKPIPWYASAKSFAEFKPSHASVRLAGNAQFVVRGRTAVDPSSVYELRLLKVSKDHREILLSQAHGTITGSSATSKLDEDTIPVRFEEYGSSSYKITPEQTLKPGEYALSVRGVVTELYCFGVQ